MPALKFDAATHTFWRDGQRVLSVTQILRRCGLVSPWWTDEARNRGTRVHTALHRCQTRSDREAREGLCDGDDPFYMAGRHALDVFGIGVLAAEELVDGGTYAGWLDLRCTLRGFREPFVIDFKSGRASAWTPLQLAAYAAPQPDYHRRAFIELQPNGKPKLTTCHETRGDLRNWHACVTVAQLQLALEIPDDGD
jgi:hypothetical protein